MGIIVILTNDNVRIYITAEPCTYIEHLLGKLLADNGKSSQVTGGTQRASSMVNGENAVEFSDTSSNMQKWALTPMFVVRHEAQINSH